MKTKKHLLNSVLNCLTLVSLFAAFFVSGLLTEKIINGKTSVQVYGIWFRDGLSGINDYKGSFICINIDEVKDLKQLDETCKHEAGHEIWARICEENMTRCENI